ncbi:tetratricopeptide repeat protein [uncultured Parasphingopyxis sp.]|uniref:tetratricopeptide repeat protein n=1 Tax=uncultured Parasphingopyxis sp. TaxID=1547918 RepID=UPI0026301689|nr:tetratricopeptide repeat protein [uncultured Parasphingopyxis sp.]
MKFVSKFTLATAMAFGMAAVVPMAPASAQEEAAQFNAANISEAVRGPVAAAQTALQEEGTDLAAVRAQLETAAGAIQNNDDRFIVGQLMLQLGVKMQQAGQPADQVQTVQGRGLRLAVDSNLLPTAQRSTYYGFLGNMANQAENWPEAIEAYTEALRYNPNNADAAIQLALAQFRSNNNAAGYEAADRAFAAAQEAGTDIPANWVTVPLNAAIQARDVERISTYGPLLVSIEPTPAVWSQTLLGYASAARLDDQATLDVMRLLRAANALDQATYTEYANLALRRGYPGEAQSVIEEGQAAGVTFDGETTSEVQSRLSSDRSSLGEARASAASDANGMVALNTADAYVGYGEYGPAMELYRLAKEKGGIDTSPVDLRMAAALYAQNQTAQARQAFESVTGSRETLAKFWLAWLDQQGGAEAAAPAESATE